MPVTHIDVCIFSPEIAEQRDYGMFLGNFVCFYSCCQTWTFTLLLLGRLLFDRIVDSGSQFFCLHQAIFWWQAPSRVSEGSYSVLWPTFYTRLYIGGKLQIEYLKVVILSSGLLFTPDYLLVARSK